MGVETEAPKVILLVDDNPTNLGVLVEALRDAGYKLRVAQDGESAIAQIPYAKPDLILLDVMMPGISGFETCRRLKSHPETHDIPVMFMTALSDTFDKVQGFQVGAVDYITKPFEVKEVLSRVQTHLSIQSLQHQLQLQNQQLQAEVQERRKAEQALHVFLHAVSHDLRNPVTGGLMVLQNLLEHANRANADAIQVSTSILQRMIQSHERQLALINSLLESQSNEMNGPHLTLRPLHLDQLVEQLLAEWEPTLHANDVQVHVSISSELPAAKADPNQLWRVYENLIANALKHNPPGITLTISASVLLAAPNSTHEATATPARPDTTPTMLRCTLQDNGSGIPPEQCATMFELYKRGDSARRTVGLGLGLYLCRQIITAHGGQIGAMSTPGQGSLFWFTLPVWP